MMTIDDAFRLPLPTSKSVGSCRGTSVSLPIMA